MNIPGLPPFNAPDSIWNMDLRYREGYVASKYRLAQRFQPRRICEIGVYSGIAACCFLAASPTAEYLGIDIMEGGIVAETREKLRALGYNSQVITADSRTLDTLPGEFDFVHVDGNHETQVATHDTILAWNALTLDGVLLVDDAHNMEVVSGVTAALYAMGVYVVDWSYCGEGVGTMVVRKQARAEWQP